MKTTAILVLLITCAALGTALYYVSTTQRAAFATGAETKSPESTNISSLVQKNAAYRNKIKELERENQNLLTQLQALKHPAATQPGQSDAQQAYEYADYSQALAQQQKSAAEVRELTEYLSEFSGLSPADINRDLNNKFSIEATEHQWADEHERKLSQLFIENNNLAQYVPETIDCRTTRCRVTIPISSYAESNQVMQEVTAALEKNSVGLEQAMVLSVPEPSTGFVNFYIARNGEVKIFE